MTGRCVRRRKTSLIRKPLLGRLLARMRLDPVVAPNSPTESFWQRWSREVAKRLEDWKFGLVGFVGPALLAALVVSPLVGILYAAVVTSLVLMWSVMATWIA